MRRPTTILATTVARLVLPFLLLFSVELLLVGHNRPGGGFIAGVMVVAAIALQYVTFGVAAGRRLPRGSFGLAAAGLLLALGSGVAGLVSGHGFLKSWVIHWSFPLLGEVEWATAFIFDLGIFLLVTGVGLTLLTLIAEDRP